MGLEAGHAVSTLLTGWSRTKELRSRGVGGGVRMREPPTVGDGPAHAVLEGSDLALCGALIRLTGRPWPSALGAKCRDCVHGATAQASPLG
jgi:hypothetical protein